MRDIADIGHDIAGFILGDLVEAVVEVVGNCAAFPARALPSHATDQHEGRVALGVQIHDQHAALGPRGGGMGQHDGDGRLAHATLSVRHRQELRHTSPSLETYVGRGGYAIRWSSAASVSARYISGGDRT